MFISLERMRNMDLEPTCRLFMLLFLCSTVNGNSNGSELTNQITYPQNVACGVYDAIVATDAVHHLYKPHFIWAARCNGSDNVLSPTERHCAPVTWQDYNISVHDGEGGKVILMANHTNCKYKCKGNAASCNMYQTWDESTCKCKCNEAMKAECKKPLEWTNWNASCCACPFLNVSECVPRYFDSKTRVPRYFDSKTCVCVKKRGGIESDCDCNKSSLSVKYVAVLAFIELLIVVTASYVVFMCFCGDRSRQRRQSFVNTLTRGLRLSSLSTTEKTTLQHPPVFDDVDA